MHQFTLKRLNASFINQRGRAGDCYLLFLSRIHLRLFGWRSRGRSRITRNIMPRSSNTTPAKLIHLRGKELLIHTKDPCGALDEYCSLYGIRDESNATHNICNQLSTPQGITCHLLSKEVDLEVDEVRLLFIQETLEFATAMAPCEGVWVFPIG